ncbi:hypothetical protein DYB31_002639 [Aphanomyces astaci]|uniref:Uncharacterized protein n=1 Tax=Aphanomyces astaci TaxID=112090 RepID=A0A397ESN5_APHAT|nr:hypothetical protein DYB31_002639 [Aphanomyces astaci]
MESAFKAKTDLLEREYSRELSTVSVRAREEVQQEFLHSALLADVIRNETAELNGELTLVRVANHELGVRVDEQACTVDRLRVERMESLERIRAERDRTVHELSAEIARRRAVGKAAVADVNRQMERLWRDDEVTISGRRSVWATECQHIKDELIDAPEAIRAQVCHETDELKGSLHLKNRVIAQLDRDLAESSKVPSTSCLGCAELKREVLRLNSMCASNADEERRLNTVVEAAEFRIRVLVEKSRESEANVELLTEMNAERCMLAEQVSNDRILLEEERRAMAAQLDAEKQSLKLESVDKLQLDHFLGHLDGLQVEFRLSDVELIHIFEYRVSDSKIRTVQDCWARRYREGSNTTWCGTRSAFYKEFVQKSMSAKMVEITMNSTRKAKETVREYAWRISDAA